MADLSPETVRFIKSFKDYEKTSLKKGFQNLEGITELNSLLNDPSTSYQVIHIAGSKGKGSTAHLISSILQSAGYRVGLFTSPHIHDIRERIRFNGRIIDKKDYDEVLVEISRRIDLHKLKTHPSFFDLFTVAALLFFQKKQCDFAVFETGLGGLYDSTNIVHPAASVITFIEKEHALLLGDSLEEIAFHKCGIIKKGVPVFTGVENPSVLSYIQKKTVEQESPLYSLKEHVNVINSSTGIGGTEIALNDRGEIRLLTSPLIGSHQINNILQAWLVVKTLIPKIDFSSLSEGIARTKLPGRFEIISQNPPVILEVAHTAASVRSTMDILEHEGYTRGCLIFGCCEDKEIDLIAENLGTSLTDIFITSFDHSRCGSPQAIYQSFYDHSVRAELKINPRADLLFKDIFKKRECYDYILVMGSFFLLSQIDFGDLRPDQS